MKRGASACAQMPRPRMQRAATPISCGEEQRPPPVRKRKEPPPEGDGSSFAAASKRPRSDWSHSHRKELRRLLRDCVAVTRELYAARCERGKPSEVEARGDASCHSVHRIASMPGLGGAAATPEKIFERPDPHCRPAKRRRRQDDLGGASGGIVERPRPADGADR